MLSSSSCSCCSCQTPILTMFSNKASPFLHKFHFYPYYFRHTNTNSYRFRCPLDHIAPKIAFSSSISSVLTPANIIAAASSGSPAIHGAVTSAITHVAVTVVAIASGACLSTKVDFLWPKVEDQPGSFTVEGVDVTGLSIFGDVKVQKAIAFAKSAHHGQFRKTGNPYLIHCVHTGRILAMLVPSSGLRAFDTIVAGILHDVVDDTHETLNSIEEEFGEDVAKLVAGVSRLSFINQGSWMLTPTSSKEDSVVQQCPSLLEVTI